MSFLADMDVLPSSSRPTKAFRGLISDIGLKGLPKLNRQTNVLNSQSAKVLQKMNMYKEMSAFSINIDKQQRNLSGPEEKERIASFQEREEKGVTKSAKMLPPLIKNQVALQRIIQKTVRSEERRVGKEGR